MSGMEHLMGTCKQQVSVAKRNVKKKIREGRTKKKGLPNSKSLEGPHKEKRIISQRKGGNGKPSGWS